MISLILPKIGGIADDVCLKLMLFLSHQIAHTTDAGMHFQRHENIDSEYKIGHAWNKSHRELGNDIWKLSLLRTKCQQSWAKG